jgi:hypothetical protein
VREGKEHDLPSRIAASPDLALTQLLWSGSGITPERNRKVFIFLLTRLAPALDKSPRRHQVSSSGVAEDSS